MSDKTKILVIGSLAYDNVMQFDGFFKEISVPDDYNIALTTNGRSVTFGGCGGNIAYSLKLLGEDPILLSVAGSDFEQYKAWLISKGINTDNIYISDRFMTAAAFIATDKDQNQITMFDSGALGVVKTTQTVKLLSYGSIALAIITPDNVDRMISVAKECKELEIPFIFAPAQVTPYIKAPDMTWAIQNAEYIIFNDYEAELLAKQMGIPKTGLPMMAQGYIETHGEKGSTIMSKKEGTFYVRAVQASKIVDPTGCGDAFAAGVAMSIRNGLPIQKACQAGALMAAYNLEKSGTQTHTFTMEEFNQRFADNFGETFI